VGTPQPARTRPRSTLTPQRIAAAAVAIADTEGLDAVTMRRLAADLGVAPMAAYRYVSGKDELLELMVDHVYGELTLPSETKGWRESCGSSPCAPGPCSSASWVTRTAVFTLTRTNWPFPSGPWPHSTGSTWTPTP